MKKNKKLIKSIKAVMKGLETDWVSCDFKGKKIHYADMDCASCKAGLCHSFLEHYLWCLENDEK